MLMYDEAGERELVAACVSQGVKCDEISKDIAPDDIYNPALALIFKTACDIYVREGHTTFPAVRAELIANGQEKHIDLLHELIKEYPLVIIEPVVKSIKLTSKRRKLHEIMNHGLSSGDVPDDVAGEIISKLVEAYSPKKKNIAHVSEIINKGLDNSNEYLKTVPWIDGYIKGLKRDNLVVIGARTHVGKTITCIDLARACSRDYNVLFFSLEMGMKQITRMLLTQLSGVPTDHIGMPDMSEQTKMMLEPKKTYCCGLNLTIVENVRTIGQISTVIRSEHMRRPVDFVIIDYLQRVYSNDTRQARYLQIGDVCKALKDIAGDIGTCIITPSQMSRQSDASSSEPELYDLRESGDIENDADVIILMWKPNKESKNISVKCAKNRNNGLFFRHEMTFDSKYIRFIEQEVSNFNNYYEVDNSQ